MIRASGLSTIRAVSPRSLSDCTEAPFVHFSTESGSNDDLKSLSSQPPPPIPPRSVCFPVTPPKSALSSRTDRWPYQSHNKLLPDRRRNTSTDGVHMLRVGKHETNGAIDGSDADNGFQGELGDPGMTGAMQSSAAESGPGVAGDGGGPGRSVEECDGDGSISRWGAGLSKQVQAVLNQGRVRVDGAATRYSHLQHIKVCV